MATTPAQIAGRADNLKEQSRRAWRLIRETATLVGPSARFLTTCEAHTYAYSVVRECNPRIGSISGVAHYPRSTHAILARGADDLSTGGRVSASRQRRTKRRPAALNLAPRYSGVFVDHAGNFFQWRLSAL